MPTVSLKTIGCRLNQAETARIAAQFEDAGWLVSEPGGPCDVAVINTCTITHHAERDCARWARRLRREGARLVVLAGCAVEHDGETLKAATGADLIAGQSQKFSLPQRLASEFALAATRDGSGASPCSENSAMPPVFETTRGLVKVQDGCDFRCSYCIVPDTRGIPCSRPLPDIMDDIQRLADAGYREITLTGANLGCYHAAPHGLIDLLERIEPISGLARIRIGSIETTTVEREVIDFMASSQKLCRFLHLPLQSGDNGVLRDMRRRYSVAQFRGTVEYAVARMPDLGLGTDVIVGFPGEDDHAFRNTLALIRDLPFSNLHVFSYSPRRGTPAAAMPDQVPSAIKKQRVAELITLGKSKRQNFAKTFIGKPVTILVEKSTRDTVGWTAQYLPVRIPGGLSPRNTLITCVPERLSGETLIATRS
jgi:threonylcarbamoyladenosine tRNA methylthiotransferase MtaB